MRRVRTCAGVQWVSAVLPEWKADPIAAATAAAHVAAAHVAAETGPAGSTPPRHLFASARLSTAAAAAAAAAAPLPVLHAIPKATLRSATASTASSTNAPPAPVQVLLAELMPPSARDPSLGFSAEELAAIVSSAKDALVEAGIEGATVVAASPRVLHVEVDVGAVSAAIAALTTVPEVVWVQPKRRMKPYNAEAQWVVQSASSGSRPFWDVGLRGEGIVVAGSDSGLDTRLCFFADAARPVKYMNLQQPSSADVDMSHRKVVTYVDFADRKSSVNCHGTHVFGSVAGRMTDSGHALAKHQGMAPEAKLAFIDIGIGEDLVLPDDYYEALLKPVYMLANARIHTNSWGSPINFAGTEERDIDRFIHDHRDMTVLFAAGNDGMCGDFTVGSPAVNKNGIAVGASLNGPNTFTANCDARPRSNIVCDIHSNWYDAARSNIKGVAAFSARGPSFDGRNKPDVVAPGHRIISARSPGSDNAFACGTGVCSAYAAESECGTSQLVLAMSGTSMATPVTAGHVALVQQYFKEGFYPTGLRDGGASLFPSAALVKALLVNSAVDLQGGYVEATPSSEYRALAARVGREQGYGRVQLSRALPLAGNFQLFVVNEEDEVQHGAALVYCLNVPSSARELTVTLAWTDPPAAAGAAVQLVHNLDLVVQTPSGQWYLGNGARSGHGASASAAEVADKLNNVEQVVLAAPTAGVYAVRVVGTAVPLNAQTFGLAVTAGAVQRVANCADSPALDDCPNACSGHGTCGTSAGVGVCSCQAGYTGADCSARTCLSDCSGHGACQLSGACSCQAPYFGAYCQFTATPVALGSLADIDTTAPYLTFLNVSGLLPPPTTECNAMRISFNIPRSVQSSLMAVAIVNAYQSNFAADALLATMRVYDMSQVSLHVTSITTNEVLVAVLSLASPCGSGITARVQRAASCVNAASALQPNMLVQLLVALVCLAGVHALAWRP